MSYNILLWVPPDPNIKKFSKDKKIYIHKIYNKTKSEYLTKLINDSSSICETTWRVIGQQINNKNEQIHKNKSMCVKGGGGGVQYIHI